MSRDEQAAATSSRRCPSVSVGGLRCQYPEGHQASHGYQGAEWSVGRSSPGDTIRRITKDWLGFKPTPDHLAQLEDAVIEAVDALEAEVGRLRVAEEAFSTGDYETMEDALRG